MPKREYCNCHGIEHGLLKDESTGLAKQCQNCGNIYCMAQRDGDCLFCGAKNGQLTIDAFQQDIDLMEYNKKYQEADASFFKDSHDKPAEIQQSQELLEKALQLQANIYRNVEAGMPDNDAYEYFDCQGDNVDCGQFC